ncbi:hypothetical protein X945_591 [Burkholderia pseudomallei ABCPW 107]|uniref:hypothetical protein n=1 Tax=Burkholderia pseudomallei TaxID=28450 RepID=UPI0005321535|nr:hypothetical protein [Burkholderia pseudomallei]KGS44985.1 hypothetical protein X945_591 [Burkholderia pseudomallei ABCPW 107]
MELQQRLASSYPLFFRAMNCPEAYPSNIALLGIQCGAGWYAIIDQLADKIEREIQALWAKEARLPRLLVSLEQALREKALLEAYDPYPVLPFCRSIQTTNGLLDIRLVFGFFRDMPSWNHIRDAVEKAELRARSVCECCGSAGTFRKYWSRVYCNDCIAEEAES